jgi:hypothetical protein
MILTKKALAAINTPKIRNLLALKLGHTEQWIIQLRKKNDPNGPLTTMAAMGVIRENTGLTDFDILEDVQEPAKA